MRAASKLVFAAGAVGLSVTVSVVGVRAIPGEGEITARDPVAYSNIYRRDHVGPEVCGECHSKRYRQWSANLHRSMNQRADAPGVVVGDFGDRVVRYAGGSARFHAVAGRPAMTLRKAGGPARTYRITRTIGSRYLQEYVGVPLAGPEAASRAASTIEVRLPFGFLLRRRQWLHQQYFDSWFGAEYDRRGRPRIDAYAPITEPWSRRCIWCHNTYPFELRLLRAGGRRLVGTGREQFFSLQHTARPAAQVAAVREHNELPPTELLAVGITCESCHLGGREHARHDRPIRFEPVAPELVARAGIPSLAGGRRNSRLLNSVCAQCHSTPADRFAHGGVTRNSSEALDLFAGSCTSRIKCTDCHDPHVKGPGAGAPPQARHLAACIRCHDQLATTAAALAHSRHTPQSASCLDCHMPKIVQGVSSFVRSHRIGRPAPAAMLRKGAPNACNLCHLDRSIRWTLAELERGWSRRLAPTRAWLRGYAGDLDQPVGEVWLRSNDRTLRALAAAAYARSPLGRTVLKAMLDGLDDPVAYYRMWMVYAVEQTLGRPLSVTEYDPTAPPATRAEQAARLRARAARGAL